MGNSSSKKSPHVLLVGLDNAGKTSLLYNLTNKNIDTVQPTSPQNPFEKIKVQNQKLIIWDLSGKESFRNKWRHYFVGNDIVIFVIDSTDRDRLEESKEELAKLLNEPLLRDSPFLILLTKNDLANQMTQQDIEDQININTISPSPQNANEANRKIKFFSTSSLNGSNIKESFAWIVEQHKERVKREKKK
ncbi:hypothetical protein DICPUDRAFT_41641 [Dictyostelium purpureum]|uniref:Uncharacterized protein n=1 Tax=Dictyostelium purpureum TaxID=5786 RepID=F1A0G3_DICPU|nr:uncharacterized protein DICPUDRAFT_41641 [Dictyostelium purpureum]EGC30305.1 hypothetical protein DICPUDRAFT_41641 [Dictyostelium purpureum]|eukprot:XP_003293156.1 hypothetical protein DICPUDRAFT_41641 [Dictyostelium purpureum]